MGTDCNPICKLYHDANVSWIYFDKEVVGEDFFSVTGDDKGEEEEYGELTKILTCHEGGGAWR